MLYSSQKFAGNNVALGLRWSVEAERVPTSRLLQLARRRNAGAYYSNPNDPTQYALLNSDQTRGKVIPGAMLLALAYPGRSAVSAIEVDDDLFWIVAVHSGVVAPDTDILIQGPAEALAAVDALLDQHPSAILVCPARWGLEGVELTVDALLELGSTVGTMTPIISNTDRVKSFFGKKKNKQFVIGGAALYILYLGSVQFNWGGYSDAELEAERARLDAAQNGQTGQSNSLDQLADKYVAPWVHMAGPLKFTSLCVGTLNKVVPVPGWSIKRYSCSSSDSRVELSKQIGGFVRNLRLSYSDDIVDLSADMSSATVVFPYPSNQSTPDERAFHAPLTVQDAKQYIADLFTPYAGTVQFDTLRVLDIPTDDLDRLVKGGIQLPQAMGFSIELPQQPEQWAHILDRIPTVSISRMETSDFTKFTWKIEGYVYVR